MQLSKRQQRRRLAAIAYVDNADSFSEIDITNHDNVESCNIEDELVAEKSENRSIGETSNSSSQEEINDIENNDINIDIDEEILVKKYHFSRNCVKIEI